jgi:hypothetical protein
MDLVSVFACRYLVFPAAFAEEIVFPTVYFGHVDVAVWIHIWVFHSVPLIFMSFFLILTNTMMFLFL